MAEDQSDRTKNLLKRINQDYEFAKAERARHTGGWKKARKQMASEWDELKGVESDEDLAQWFYVPKTLSMVSRVLCSCLSHFFPPEGGRLSKISAMTPNPYDGMAAAILDEILHAKVGLQLNPVRQFQDSWDAGLTEGVGVLKGGWVKRGRVNRPTLEYHPNENVLWDPYATTPDDIKFFMQEVWLTEDQLWERQRANVYQNVPELLAHKPVGAKSDDWRQEVTAPGNKMRRLYKVLEFWGPQQMLPQEVLAKMHDRGQHKPSQDIVATVHRDKVLLRADPNPYAKLFDDPTPYEKLPYWLTVPLPKRGSTYAHSMVLRVRPLQREINLTRNQRRQAVQMEMARKVIFDRNRQLDLKALARARYGGFAGVNGPPGTAVHDFALNTSTANMVQEEALMDREFQDLVGVMEPHFGRQPGGQRTATGMTIIAEEGNVTQGTVLNNIGLSSVIPVMRFFAECCIEYVKPDEAQAIIGSENPLPPLKSILKRDYKYEVAAGASASSKAVRLRNLQSALQMWGQVANAAPQIAFPAMIEIGGEIQRLLGVGSVQHFMQRIQAGGGQPFDGAQGGGQMRGMPNAQNEMAMAEQGRMPMPEEMRA